MNISGIGQLNNSEFDYLKEIRGQIEQLKLQLASGKKATTYGKLGTERGIVINFRQELSQITSYQSSIQVVDVRLRLMETNLKRISEMGIEGRGEIEPNSFLLQENGKVHAQVSSEMMMKEMIGLLNGDVAGRQMFSGQSVHTKPVVSFDEMILGANGKAGLKTVTDERLVADLGPVNTAPLPTSMGRLTASAAGASTVTISRGYPPSHEFGMRIKSISEGLSNATLTQNGTAGDYDDFSIAFTGQPTANEGITVAFELPDGSTATTQLSATANSPPGKYKFTIGGTPTQTADNFRTALIDEIGSFTKQELPAASNVRAATDFFTTANGTAPKRVTGGADPNATSLIDGTTANTVSWYAGDNGTTVSSRNTAQGRVDSAINVNYGVRANEKPFSKQLAMFGALTIQSFTNTDDEKDRYFELANRVREGLFKEIGDPNIDSIRTELSVAHKAANNAKIRHTQTFGMLEGLRDGIEGVVLEEVAISLLTLQTRLQASFLATARINELSLANFL